MESSHFESQSAPLLTPEPPLSPPHFEKSGYAPEVYIRHMSLHCHKIDRVEAVGLSIFIYTSRIYDFCEYVNLVAILWKIDIL